MGKLQKQRVKVRTIKHSNADSKEHLEDVLAFHQLNELARLKDAVKDEEKVYKSFANQILEISGIQQPTHSFPNCFFQFENANAIEVSGPTYESTILAERERLHHYISKKGDRCDQIPLDRRLKLFIAPMLPSHSAFLRMLPEEEEREHIRLQIELVGRVVR